MYSNNAVQQDFIKFNEDISNILTILMKLSHLSKEAKTQHKQKKA